MTHADIIIALGDGTFLLADCGSDGYPDWVGEILLHHYTDFETIHELVKIGEFSPLDETVEETRIGNMRDLVEEPTEMPARITEDCLDTQYKVGPYTGYPGEHRYLWRDNQWWYQTYSMNVEIPTLTSWVPLIDVDRTQYGGRWVKMKVDKTS